MSKDFTSVESSLDKKLKLRHTPITKKIDNFVLQVGEIFNWLWVILIAVIIFNSTLYNGWRQLYFIYPSLIYFSIIASNYFFNLKNKKLFQTFFLIIFLNLISISFWMFKNHPHQYVFFNNFISTKNIHKGYQNLSRAAKGIYTEERSI